MTTQAATLLVIILGLGLIFSWLGFLFYAQRRNVREREMRRKLDLNAIAGLRSLNEWASAVWALAEEKGFRDDYDPTSREAIAIYCTNLHGEVSELWEAFRAGKLYEPCDKATKMAAAGIQPLTCVDEELADIIIRALDVAAALGRDIDMAVMSKHAYNKTRPFKHGGKRA